MIATALIAVFLFELSGQPVGLVRLRLDGDAFAYASHPVFTDGPGQVGVRTLALDGRRIQGQAARPASLALLQRPALGCLRVEDELTGARGELCVDQLEGSGAKGTLFGEAFFAEYDGAGGLISFTRGLARFHRVDPATALGAWKDPFAGGFAIDGATGALALAPPPRAPAPSPPPKAATWDARDAARLARGVRASFPGARTPRCLRVAERYVARAREKGREAELVLGLVKDGARAYPHAWVRAWTSDGVVELDPTLGVSVMRSTHLPLADAGRVYLELLAGERRIIARGRPLGR